MVAEGVEDVGGCEEHVLLLDVSGQCRGLGYNRYRQACPDNDALVVNEPTPMRASLFDHQRVLTLAAGGGCSAVITEARETLAACCVAVIRARLEAGDAESCAQVMALAYRCDTPALAPLLPAAEECVRRRRAEVAALLREGDEEIDVEDALGALAAIHRSAAGMDVPL